MRNPANIPFVPEIRMRDGRIIRLLADAIALLREHELRPGVDARDEVLHRLERARSEQDCQQAMGTFITWAQELDLPAPPEAAHLRP